MEQTARNTGGVQRGRTSIVKKSHPYTSTLPPSKFFGVKATSKQLSIRSKHLMLGNNHINNREYDEALARQISPMNNTNFVEHHQGSFTSAN